MYGYVVPYKAQLNMQDYVLYRAFYCGLCKATGKVYGQLPRFTTNYDMTFLSVLLHDCLTQDVTFKEERCVCNPFKKKLCVMRNPLLDRLAAVNIVLSYYKAVDAVIDKEGIGARAVRRALKRPFKRAMAVCPQAAEIVSRGYETLRKLERENAVGIDRVAHPFAQMMKELGALLLGETADENKLALCYNVGKFVYIADALDDAAEDYRKKRYNPFVAEYGYAGTRAQFIEAHREELAFVLHATINRAIESFNRCAFTQSYDLMRNVVYNGLREKAKELLTSEKKLPPPKV